VSERTEEEERPDLGKGDPDAPETTDAASEESVPAPETVRYVFDADLRMLWESENAPEIAPGTLVVLDLWGEGPAAYYAQVLASWHLSLATCLEDLGAGIERVLADIEQAEEDERTPEDLVFWTAIVERLLGMSQSIMEVTTEPREADRVLLMSLIDEGARELLEALKVRSYQNTTESREDTSKPVPTWSTVEVPKPVTGAMEIPKAKLRQAASLARDLGAEVDMATAAEDVEASIEQEIEWFPFDCDGKDEPSVMQGDNYPDLLRVIHFAAAKVGIDLATLEIGFSGGQGGGSGSAGRSAVTVD
jgi:hypothetical protein